MLIFRRSEQIMYGGGFAGYAHRSKWEAMASAVSCRLNAGRETLLIEGRLVVGRRPVRRVREDGALQLVVRLAVLELHLLLSLLLSFLGLVEVNVSMHK